MIEDRSTANADPSGKTTYVFQDRAGKPGGGKGPLVSNGYYPTMTGHPFMMCTEEVYAFEGNGSRPSHKGTGFSNEDVMYTLNTTEVHGVMYPCLMDQGGAIMNVMDDQTGTIRAEMGGHAPVIIEEATWVDRHVNIGTDDLAPTLCAKYGTGGNNMPCVLEREPFVYDSHPMDSRVTPCTKDISQTLSTRFGGENDPNTILVREKEMNEMKYVVRRITPRECERLQGFPTKGEIGPDGKVMERDYTDIPWPKGQCPDSHRYKALGNSMAVPVMRLIAESIDFALSHPITEDKSDKIAYQTSLFDF